MKKNTNKKNLVNVTKSGLLDLENKIKEISKTEIENERLYDIVNTVQSEKGQGLKILTPDQMLSRLPISLAQLKARNNLEKHKNEIRQLLYSLYRSKKPTKTIYNKLINNI